MLASGACMWRAHWNCVQGVAGNDVYTTYLVECVYGGGKTCENRE